MARYTYDDNGELFKLPDKEESNKRSPSPESNAESRAPPKRAKKSTPSKRKSKSAATRPMTQAKKQKLIAKGNRAMEKRKKLRWHEIDRRTGETKLRNKQYLTENVIIHCQ